MDYFLQAIETDHDYALAYSGAEKEFRRAIELNPSYETAHHWYGELLST